MKYLALLVLCLTMSQGSTTAFCKSLTGIASELKIATVGKAVRIVCSQSADEQQMGKYLIKFLQERKLSVQPKLGNTYDSHYDGPQWILATAATLNALKPNSQPPVFDKACKPEAFMLAAVRTTNGPVLTMVGKTISGLRAAVARLIATSANHGEYLSIAQGKITVDPLIKLRLMNVGQAARRQAPAGSPFEYANYETWTPKAIRAYPEMMWQLGFNGIQVDECRGYGAIQGSLFTRARRAVKTVSQGAHDWHLFVSLSQWGDVMYREEVTNCWNDPQQHVMMVKFIDEFAKTYAPYVDNITCRFCDPGGCTSNGCDLYKTPQVITNEYMKAFQKINPRITGTLSLWANIPFWFSSPNPVDMSNIDPSQNHSNQFGRVIPDGAKFLDATYMPGDVGIAIHRLYNRDQVRAINASGRPADIKGWYIGDQEMNDNLTINMTSVDEMIGSYPEEARHTVNSQTVEMCFHGLPQVVNHYVAAQKLIDPTRPLSQLMHEFCTAAFGPINAEAMTALYFACENGVNSPIPHPTGFGTAAYNAKLHKVLAKAEKVKVAKEWKPNFRFPVPVQHYVDMLIARLRLTLAVSEAKQAIDTARVQNNIGQQIPIRSIHIDVQDMGGININSTGGKDIALTTRLDKGQTIGQTFEAVKQFDKIGIYCTTWGSQNSGMTASLYDNIGGKLIKSTTVQNMNDNDHIWLYSTQPAGKYYMELSNPTGDKIGIYNSQKAANNGQLMSNQQPVAGEPEVIHQLKVKALKNLPKLPIDPVYSQDASVIVQDFRTQSIPEMIMDL